MANSAKNEQFYDSAYASGSLFKVLTKLFLSYDQLSKTRRNIAAIRKTLESPTPLSILDYGFGHGTFLYRVPKTHKITGYELSTEAIQNIRRLFALLGRKIAVSPKDEFFSVPKQKFDLIYCSHVLEHVEDDQQLLEGFHNSLRVGGKLLLNVPINEVWRDPNHVREYCCESIQQQLEITGFVTESVKEADKWTAFILDKEFVSKSLPRPLTKALRLFLALLPISLLDVMENALPKSFQFQQLIVVARKI